MLGTIVRFIVSALVLMIVGWILPGVTVSGFWGALVAAIIIAILGYVAERLMGKSISPQGRGVVGFISAAVVIYLAQFLVPQYLSVSLLGSLLAAFVIGVIDVFVPTELR